MCGVNFGGRTAIMYIINLSFSSFHFHIFEMKMLLLPAVTDFQSQPYISLYRAINKRMEALRKIFSK